MICVPLETWADGKSGVVEDVAVTIMFASFRMLGISDDGATVNEAESACDVDESTFVEVKEQVKETFGCWVCNHDTRDASRELCVRLTIVTFVMEVYVLSSRSTCALIC